MAEKSKYVLIVEDEAGLSQAVAFAIRGLSCEVAIASDGLKAENMLQERVPDLIFLDLILPERDGFELLKLIRENKKLKDVPVIIITNYDKPVSLSKLEGLSFQEYITKTDIRVSELAKYAQKYLS